MKETDKIFLKIITPAGQSANRSGRDYYFTESYSFDYQSDARDIGIKEKR